MANKEIQPKDCRKAIPSMDGTWKCLASGNPCQDCQNCQDFQPRHIPAFGAEDDFIQFEYIHGRVWGCQDFEFFVFAIILAAGYPRDFANKQTTGQTHWKILCDRRNHRTVSHCTGHHKTRRGHIHQDLISQERNQKTPCTAVIRLLTSRQRFNSIRSVFGFTITRGFLRQHTGMSDDRIVCSCVRFKPLFQKLHVPCVFDVVVCDGFQIFRLS